MPANDNGNSVTKKKAAPQFERAHNVPTKGNELSFPLRDEEKGKRNDTESWLDRPQPDEWR